jgi:L-arabinokinase
MYQSHASYNACGLGSDGTDLLVDLVREAGEGEGLYGAKITGGGSGGTVAVLARADAVDRVGRIAADYAERTGREPYVFEGTSDGASVTGAWRE